MRPNSAPRPQSPKRPSKVRAAAQNLALALGMVVVLLLVLEVVLRTTHVFGSRISWREPHPLLGWRGTPDFEYWTHKENDHPISGRLNNFGWRDRDRTLEKPPGTYRIAVIGDSFVEGMQVELDSTFVSLAENALNAGTGRRIEMLNFGQAGMTQSEELALLQSEILDFSPDMVVVVFWPSNDIREIHRSTALNELRPFYDVTEDGELVLDTRFNQSRGYKIKTTVRPFKQRSAVVSFLGERYNALRLARRQTRIGQTEVTPTRLGGYMTLYTDEPDPAYLKNYELCKRLIAEMADYCKAHGVAFVLVSGTPIYETEDIAAKQAIDPTFDAGFFDRDLAAWAAERGIEFVGLHEPFTRRHRATGRSLNWSHWNYEGHRVVADVLVARLRPLLAQGQSGGGAAPAGSSERQQFN